MQHGFFTVSSNKGTPKNPRETVGSGQTSLVWHGNIQYCAEEYEKSYKKQTLYKTACGRIWTGKSSNEALKMSFPFFCSHSCITCKLHFFWRIFTLFLNIPVPPTSPEIVLSRCSSESSWLHWCFSCGCTAIKRRADNILTLTLTAFSWNSLKGFSSSLWHDSTGWKMAVFFLRNLSLSYFLNFSLSVCFFFISTHPGLIWLWGWRATWWFVLGQHHAFAHLFCELLCCVLSEQKSCN